MVAPRLAHADAGAVIRAPDELDARGFEALLNRLYRSRARTRHIVRAFDALQCSD